MCLASKGADSSVHCIKSRFRVIAMVQFKSNPITITVMHTSTITVLSSNLSLKIGPKDERSL